MSDPADEPRFSPEDVWSRLTALMPLAWTPSNPQRNPDKLTRNFVWDDDNVGVAGCGVRVATTFVRCPTR